MNETVAKEKLIEHISKRVTLTEKDKEFIFSTYSLVNIKRKKHLFNAGSPCKIEGFVVKGTLRIYYTDTKGLDHVLYFALDDWWVGDIASYYSGDSTGLNAQALEDTWILVTDREKKEKLFANVPILERFFRIITQKHLSVLQKRFLLTVSTNASERYRELLERSPGIEQFVPQRQIASYLGILPESLSRLKKQFKSEK